MSYVDAYPGAACPCPPSLTPAPGPRRFLFPEEAPREGALLGLEPRGPGGACQRALCLLSTAVVSSSGGTGYSSGGGLCMSGGGYSSSLGYSSGGGFSSPSGRSMSGSSSSVRIISKTSSTKKSYRS